MTFSTPNSSGGRSPRPFYQNIDFAEFLNAGFEQVQRDLTQFQREEERRTPELQQPEEGAHLLSWRDRCEALWVSLPSERKLDQSRRQIPNASYQFLTAFAHFRLLAEKLGYEGVSPGLLDEGSDREENPGAFWRQVTDTISRILERTGTSKQEVRERLQEIPTEQFWEVEHSFLARVVAEEETKYHQGITGAMRRQPQSPQQEPRARSRTACDYGRAGGVQRAAKKRRAEPARKTGAERASSFAMNGSTSKMPRIMDGLDTRHIIITESSRPLRKRQKQNAGQPTTAWPDGRIRNRVVAGGDGTRKHDRASRVPLT